MLLSARSPIVLLAASLLAQAGTARGDTPVSFRNDVMAVLSKAGCNQGTCHGNQNGKGGFKLSLRGQDSEFDYKSLTEELYGRRVDRLNPARSLVLLKPALELAHEGGRRFTVGSREYEILRAWIAQGMPRDPAAAPRLAALEVSPREQVLFAPHNQVQLTVSARFSDGRVCDVGSLAVYEPANRVASVSHNGLVTGEAFGEVTVLVRYLSQQAAVRLAFMPARPDFVWSDPPEQNFVDRHVYAKLRSLRMNPSELASDSVFLRRAYLDLLGILPTAAEARAFVADPRGDKRSRLVDALLARPEFADHWALKWSDLLKNEERTLDRKGVQNFHHWIRRNIEQNVPLDRFVRELVAARGSTYSQPAANYYRANRDAITRAETTAQLFLGVRLQCAKCHNHPFDRWTQNDYYSWASFFAPVDYKVLENNRRDKNDKHEFDGEQIVTREGKEIVRDPKTGESMPPRFLGEPHYEQGTEDQLDHLAGWLTHQENPLFAKAQVNRIWYNLLGRGLVDPIDDFRATNPPSIPPLLDALAEDFVRHGFDLRHTIRTIMNSRTYQLSPVPNESNADDELNFSRAVVRRLTAEQLLDSLCQVADVPARFNGYPLGLRSGQIPGVRAVRPRDQRPSNGDEFLQLFGKPPRLLSCECERSMETTLGQTVQLISGQTINELLVRPENRLGRMLLSGRTDAELVEELYWTALSRPPSETELARFASHLAASPDRRKALEDAAWALVNAKEFVLRQ